MEDLESGNILPERRKSTASKEEARKFVASFFAEEEVPVGENAIAQASKRIYDTLSKATHQATQPEEMKLLEKGYGSNPDLLQAIKRLSEGKGSFVDKGIVAVELDQAKLYRNKLNRPEPRIKSPAKNIWGLARSQARKK